MPVYEYTALDSRGKNVNGIIDADSPIAARQKLRGSGIFPVTIKETSSKGDSSKDKSTGSVSISGFLKRVKAGEVAVMTRQLAILLAAGVPLVGSLEALLTQIQNPLLKKCLAQIKESVNEGNSLAFALAQHPRLFSNIYINMVRAGEASGALDIVLNRLAEYGEHQEVLKGRFKAALAYPAFMVLIGTSVLLFLMTVVVPDITSVFADMNQTLPAPTVILIGISHFLATYWWALSLFGCVAVVALWKFSKTNQGERIKDKFKLKVPLLGKINQKIALARFARTLGTLLESGVPLLTAMDIVRNVVNNLWIRDEIDSAMVDVEAGKSLAVPLSRSPWFPAIAIQMISVGEQSGELESMLQKIADTYEKDVESQIMALTSMLEPVMILFMAMIVFFIVVSILLPIFEMNQMVR